MTGKTEAAILSLRPGAEWSLANDDYQTLRWFDSKQKKPCAQEVRDEIARLATVEESEATKSDAYDGDASRKTVWDKTDSMTKDEFKAWLGSNISDLPSAKSALISACLEIARLRRLVAKLG